MTVDKWFEYWIDNIVCDLAPNTRRNYRERYKWNVQPVIGKMCIADVKLMHCKAVLNRMETRYSGSTIRASIKTTMDRYVHVTDESLVNAVRQFESSTPNKYKKRA